MTTFAETKIIETKRGGEKIEQMNCERKLVWGELGGGRNHE